MAKLFLCVCLFGGGGGGGGGVIFKWWCWARALPLSYIPSPHLGVSLPASFIQSCISS
jgi:hypothetical protein